MGIWLSHGRAQSKHSQHEHAAGPAQTERKHTLQRISPLWSCWRAGHESWVLSVACHPDGSAFATGSSDAKVKLWDLQTRTCAQTLTEHTDQVPPAPASPHPAAPLRCEYRAWCAWEQAQTRVHVPGEAQHSGVCALQRRRKRVAVSALLLYESVSRCRLVAHVALASFGPGGLGRGATRRVRRQT